MRQRGVGHSADKRLLGVIRLSKSRDESTSPERQREAIESIAAYRGDTIVGWAEDLDVSGKYVAPIDRPELGAWMRNRADEFDGFAAWKMDRITRRALHFHEFMEWCNERTKFFVTKSDGIDTTTKGGKNTAEMMAMVGHWEWEAIQERAKDSYDKLITTGRWRGGFLPYGYTPVKTANGWYLEIDPETSAVIREIVTRIIEGESANSLIVELNARKIPTPLDMQRIRTGKTAKGSTWRVGNLLKMLRSRTLLGQYEADGAYTATGKKVIRGSDGLPLQRAEPIITLAEWERLQATLDGNSNKRAGNRKGGSPLLRIAFCAVCGRSLYRVPGRREGESRYRCAARAETSVGCGNGSIKASELEKHVEETVLREIGHRERMIPTHIPGENHSEELATVAKAMQDMRDERDLGMYDYPEGDEEFKARMGNLVARRKRLAALPSRPAGVEWQGTGETFAEHWAGLNVEGRGRFLRAAGVRVDFLRWSDLRSPDEWPDLATATLGGITWALGPEKTSRGCPPMIDVTVPDLDELNRQGTGQPLNGAPTWAE
ncbi:recombinase family protein [Streptosporangium sp. V21-05]|uniref:recombinase family protein n=1 Tax=Streptosporangium sp. V21-05 TaxID=3446115 RepID=UPI003F536BF4